MDPTTLQGREPAVPIVTNWHTARRHRGRDRSPLAWLLALALVPLAVAACSSDGSEAEPEPLPEPAPNTFLPCEGNDDCGDLECICSICTRRCNTDDDCAGDSCAPSGSDDENRVCPNDGAEHGICFAECKEDEDCPDGVVCDKGVCRPELLINDRGSPCDRDEDCHSGNCYGLGCGPGEGRCAGLVEVCDLEDDVDYCGCDGVTVRSSNSCPSVRYASEGPCE